MDWLSIIFVIAITCAAIGYCGKDEIKETIEKNIINGGFGCGYIIIMLLIGFLVVFVLFK